ncbi:MAG: PorT family protein [Cyclobacteriaceae bacterium]|jgi:hypothetical protein|nr:PorT family protein [Cyclobacteriaceae bacterium]
MKFRISNLHIAILLIVLLAPISSHHVRAQILVGPTVGGQLNLYRFDDKDLKKFYKLNPDYNFNAGFSVAFRANKNFFLNTSFLYTQRSKILEGVLETGLSNKTTLRFIDVPILYTAEFKSKFGRDKVFKWYLGAGPTISYWLGGKGTFKNGDLNENLINPPDYDLPYKITFRKDSADVTMNEMNVAIPNRLQLGLNLAVGLIFEPAQNKKVMVNARYSFMQSFLSRESNGTFGLPTIVFYEDELAVRNHELVLSVQYFIDLRTEQRKKGKSTVKMKNGKPVK